MSEEDKIFMLNKSLVRILVCDDEDSIRGMLVETLKSDGWTVDSAPNGKVGYDKICSQPFHIILSDIQMPEMTGIELLEAVKKRNPLIEVIIMTSNATLETALKAIKSGAYDYLNKPFDDLSVVPKKLTQVAEKIMLRQQNVELVKRLKQSASQLKHLFEATRLLNGLLEMESMRPEVCKALCQLFGDPKLKVLWVEKSQGQWKSKYRVPDEQAFGGEQLFPDLDAIAQKFNTYRSLKVVRLEYEGEIQEAFVFENLNPALADFFCQEVRTCYEKVQLHAKIVGMANRDGLTMLYNHRYFQDRARQELALSKRQNAPLSMIFFDVDHFKKYNDTNGHPAGDELLRTLGGVLSTEMGKRESDVVARYGGEEFVVLLPFTPYEGAKVKAERIREAIAQYGFAHRETQPLGCVSVSVGVATIPDHAESISDLIERADQSLYHAKKQGRNRVVGFAEIPQEPAAPVESASAPAVVAENPVVVTDTPVVHTDGLVVVAENPLVGAEVSAAEVSLPQEVAAVEIVAEPPAAPEVSLESIVFGDLDATQAESAPATDPAPAPSPEVISESNKQTIEDVLQGIEEAQKTEEQTAAPTAAPIELSALMSSIESAFETAEKAKKEGAQNE